jgi:hypothetical protein
VSIATTSIVRNTAGLSGDLAEARLDITIVDCIARTLVELSGQAPFRCQVPLTPGDLDIVQVVAEIVEALQKNKSRGQMRRSRSDRSG